MRTTTLALALCVLCSFTAAEAKKRGPTGRFVGESGTLTLRYLGEGMVAVTLKTDRCSLKTQQGATFVFPHVHVVNKKGEPLLVIFYRRNQSVVYADLPAFKRDHCKGGQDATGPYKRAK